VQTARNLTRNETIIKIIEFSDSAEHSEANMAVVCLSSHGRFHRLRSLYSSLCSAAGKIISSDCLELDLEQDILRLESLISTRSISSISLQEVQ
jgi:hypothetical protein